MNRFLLCFCLPALLLPLICACSSDEAGTVGVPADETQVSFLLSLRDASTGTRAAWSENDHPEQGDGYENHVDPSTLQVGIYDAGDDSYVAGVRMLICSETSTAGQYEYVGVVEPAEGKTLTSGNYKVVVMANAPKEDLSKGISQTTTYSYDPTQVMAGNKYIPLWGVTTHQMTFAKGERNDLGTIDLLRAMAKVEINLVDRLTAMQYTIESATLTTYNKNGIVQPSGASSATSTAALDQETCMNVPDNAATSSNLAFSYSEDKNSAYLYIPEYDNMQGAEATISLALSDGTQGSLEFKEYQDGKPTGNAHDIVRNHIYRYTVDVNLGQLEVQYMALPWQLVGTTLGWKPQHAKDIFSNPFDSETDYETYQAKNGFILLPRHSYDKKTRTDTRQLFNYLYSFQGVGDQEAFYGFVCNPRYNEDHDGLVDDLGGATFMFQLTGPKGATWEAHLTNEKDFTLSTAPSDYFKNSDYPNPSDKVNKVTHGIAREKPYVLQINPVNEYTNGTSFTDLTDWGREMWESEHVVDTWFYITVRLADGTEYELEINPSYAGVSGFEDSNFPFKERRRFTGTDTRIWMRHLRALGPTAQKRTWGWVDLTRDVPPNTVDEKSELNTFQWWRVNPYWNDNYDEP